MSGRYVKITITSNWGDATLVNMESLHICNAGGTKYNDDTMVHTAGSTLNGDPKNCSTTADDGSYWQFNVANLPNWWKVDLGTSYYLPKFKCHFSEGLNTRGMKDFKIEVSADDSSWSTILETATANTGDIQTFDTSDPDTITVGVPATTCVDTFVTPAAGLAPFVSPALSQQDTFHAPSVKEVVHVPPLATLDTPIPPGTFGTNINKTITFPNLQGKHLSLRYYNNNEDSGFALYYARHKLFKTRDRVDHDARHPNLSGYHLSLKISHTAGEEFILGYTSMGLLEKME